MSLIHNLSSGITLNTEQQKFVSLVAQGRSCCLVGAAGTGKTTAVRQAITELLNNNFIPRITIPTGNPVSPKLRTGLAGIVGCAFTRRAVANLKANFPPELHPHCLTIHALLEFSPVTYETFDEATGNLVTTMRFEPLRHRGNPLPKELHTIIIEESSMVGTDLFQMLMDAIPEGHKVQLVFLGDINQLSPVFGDAILGYKLLELPSIVLTQVYRQALESPIIRLAHRILSGRQILFPELSKPEAEGGEWQVADKLRILNWKPKTSEVTAELTSIAFLKKEFNEGNYNPYSDMVIIPFNKNLGTVNISKGIATFLDNAYGIHPVEIVAGFFKKYYAVGDLVLHRNEEFIITKITNNGSYKGRLLPDIEHIFDRYGNIIGRKGTEQTKEELAKYLTGMVKQPDDVIGEMLVNAEDEVSDAASHMVYITPITVVEDYIDSIEELRGTAIPALPKEVFEHLSTIDTFSIDSRGGINNMSLAYATTCHKAQGLESSKVYIVTHKSHNVLLNREWLYTAVTRAKVSLTILCERDAFIGGINKQQIKGTTLEEKAEYFKGKVLNK